MSRAQRISPWLAVLVAASTTAVAQPPPEAGGERYFEGQYVGPASCATASCHGKAAPSDETAVLQNEYATWVHRDPHFRAHESLYGERAEIIARNLGTGRPPAGDSRCVGCHALTVPRNLQAERLDIADGISCEACHGPAGGWVDQHPQLEWSYADSLAAGMIDLRSPQRRLAVCHSCHRGNVRHHVGHELIAAGHPELVFELDNFSEAMPSHWRPFTERNAAGASPPVLSPAATWAVGQIDGLWENLEQIAGRAAASRWPEFGELACEDCHHSLAEERWRRPRPVLGRLGMPRWSPARWAMVRHLVAELAPDELPALETEVDLLAEEVSDLQTPPSSVLEVAEALAKRLRELRPVVVRARWDRTRIRTMIARIAADRDFLERSDRQSAEQAALAIQSLYSSLVAVSPGLARGPLPGTLDELFDALEEPYDYRPEAFVAVLAKLEQQVR